MKSGLEDRNNLESAIADHITANEVSMKSGLEDRNNLGLWIPPFLVDLVSMKSGLEDRNNPSPTPVLREHVRCLNEVRPGRPEQ